jgi:Rod binding domain-containing protein
MNGISTSTAVRQAIDGLAADRAVRNPPEQNSEVRQAFQDFVAGTIYKQMFKALRKTHGKPAYFHGGPAEDIFQSQLDQQVAEDLAREKGASFAEGLYEAFSRQLRAIKVSTGPPQVASASKASASALTQDAE